jgi:hypothetical protein
MVKKLTKSDIKILDYIYKMYNIPKMRKGKRGFVNKISFLFDACKEKIKRASLDRPISNSRKSINKTRLIRILENGGKKVSVGYLAKGSKKILLGVFIDTTEKVIFKGMKKGSR